jgi:hypothetical protein
MIRRVVDALKSWSAKVNAYGVRKAATRAGRRLPPAVTLAKSHKIVAAGVSYEGPLIADDTGVGVQAVTRVTRSGRIQWVRVQRFYFVFWEKVVFYLITPAPAPQGATTQVDEGDVDISLTDADRTWTVTLHQTSVAAVTEQLSKWISGKQRAG